MNTLLAVALRYAINPQLTLRKTEEWSKNWSDNYPWRDSRASITMLKYLSLSFAFDFFADVVHVVTAVLLARLDELVEVAFVPTGESLCQQLFLLRHLLFGEWFRVVDLILLFLLELLRISVVHVVVTWYLTKKKKILI